MTLLSGVVQSAATLAIGEATGTAPVSLARRMLQAAPARDQADAVGKGWSEFSPEERKQYIDEWCRKMAKANFTLALMCPEDDELEDTISHDFL